MSGGFDECASNKPENPSCSGNNDAGSFECNICLDLAQDPIVTLCGHLFCWPCLYKWLHHHSHSRECPVCKALIEEDRLVPLYGRGKTSTDPRSKSYPENDIPRRPARQRTETAPEPDHGSGFAGGFGGLGFGPMASARVGNFTLSAGFGGLFPSLFNFQVNGFPDPSISSIYGFPNSFHNGQAHLYPQRPGQGQQDNFLMMLFLVIGFFVIMALLWQ